MENTTENTTTPVAEEKPSAPRTREIQETINHLILGITMWLSASVTCITTLLTVRQPWCLITLLLPFIYTMFPQIQKFTTAVIESKYNQFKVRESKQEKQDKKMQKAQVALIKEELKEESA